MSNIYQERYKEKLRTDIQFHAKYLDRKRKN